MPRNLYVSVGRIVVMLFDRGWVRVSGMSLVCLGEKFIMASLVSSNCELWVSDQLKALFGHVIISEILA